MDDNVMMIKICKDYGWTYEQYMDTPQFFLDNIKEVYRIDSQKNKNG